MYRTTINSWRVWNNKLKKELDVLIIEDDLYFNNLLANRLESLNHDPKIRLNYHVRIRKVFDPDANASITCTSSLM